MTVSTGAFIRNAMDNQFSFKNSFFSKRRIRTTAASGSDKTLIDIARGVVRHFNSPHAHFLKNDHSTSVIRIEINGRTVVVRRDNPVSLPTFTRRLFKQSRSLKIWGKAHWLKKKGLETLTPLAVIEDYLLFIRLRSFIMVSLVEGVTFKEFLADPAVSQSSKSEVSSGILALVRKWHGLGIAHRDPKASNIMVHDNKASLIDIEDVTAPRTKFGQRRSFARDWAIVLHSLQNHKELRKKAQDEIVASFDGDPDYFSRRLVQRGLVQEHAIVGATFPGTISPEEIQAVITTRKPPQGWTTIEQTKDLIHLFHEPDAFHCLVSFRRFTQGRPKVKGVFSMALALGICGVDHAEIIEGGTQGKIEYLVYSTRGVETVETVLERLENDPVRQSEILAKAGAAAGRLHLRGFIHGDLSLANTYARKTGDGYSIEFAAASRTRWYGKRLKRRIAKDLAGINDQLNSRRYRRLAPAFQTAYRKALGPPHGKHPFTHAANRKTIAPGKQIQ
ncbi:MAG: hypothetical protein GY737_31275 [Desulfobacteraceae bacterium]|nr:hypothetical protein [Desulfobacteraceae bacterium]